MKKLHLHSIYWLIALSLAFSHVTLAAREHSSCGHLPTDSAAPQSRPKIGLVLGGGGAKGAAQVGALRVIERAGIPIDYIAGTSIGSVVGALYAAGFRADELDTLFCNQQWLNLLTDRREDLSREPYRQVNGTTYVFGFPILDKNASLFGLLRGQVVEQMLDSMLALRGCVEYECLPTPFSCVATEWRTAKEVVLQKGTIPQSVRASIAIPGIFKPANIGGIQLVDGGMLNNLPVDVVRQMGADIVIAIDLQQDKPEAPKSTSSPVAAIADMLGLGDLFGFSGIIDWAFTRPDIKKYYENCKQADIYINPTLPDFDASSFGNKNMKRMMSAGEKAAQQQWDKLAKLKAQLASSVKE